MKAIVLFAAALTVFASPAFAKSAAQTAAQDNMKTCSATWKGMSDTDKKATTRKAFMSTCMTKNKSSGSMAATPAAAPMAAAPMAATPMAATPPKVTAPKKIAAKSSGGKSAIATEGNTGTSARCKDGKTIAIKSHAGACSHHGGVAAWL